MHGEIRDFFIRMKMAAGSAFNAKRVLECGSYDINGNPRNFFHGSEYTGIDWRPGPMVDEVSLVHEYKAKPDGYFNFIIATSLLEHDPYWVESIDRMMGLLAEGGSLLITCGGPGFHEHEKETSPGYCNAIDNDRKSSGEYYQNRKMVEIVGAVLMRGRFRRIFLEDDPATKDLRLFAFGRMPQNAGMPVVELEVVS